jgi:ubiquinone/menaquinone biosynthesis C-methylase UbiE
MPGGYLSPRRLRRLTLPSPSGTRARMVEHTPADEAYDRWAAVYDRDGNPLLALDDAVVPHLVGPVRGLRVVDLGSGTGRHATRLVEDGAEVTCVDLSEGMMQVARTHLSDRGARFVRHDLRHPLPFTDESFDGVVCCLVLEHIADLPSFFREARRICKPGGFVVCSDMHPAMRLRGVQANFDDAEGTNVRVAGYEHPVSEYVTAALGAGLSLERIEEHKGDASYLPRFPRIAKYVGWPMLVAMRFRR